MDSKDLRFQSLEEDRAITLARILQQSRRSCNQPELWDEPPLSKWSKPRTVGRSWSSRFYVGSVEQVTSRRRNSLVVEASPLRGT